MTEAGAAVARRNRTGEWLVDPGFGVYVHIPFCRHRCHYCDFNTYEGLDDLHGRYADALVSDIERTDGEFPSASSVFFGGGTPTLLSPQQLGRVLLALRERIGIAPDAEITIEANPETVDEAFFDALLEAGFNRFSVGIQSLVPHVLAGLGRTHSGERALEALAAARRAGVEDINADLIYGSRWESEADWVTSLEGIIAAEPDHISAYALTIEEGTPLGTLVRTGRVPDVDPDVQADRHAVGSEMLAAAGYDRYEISNWARPGRASRHNVLYWSAGDYLGFGAGAHGHLDGERSWAVRLPCGFIEAVEGGLSTRAGSEHIDDRAGEALMLGLRLRSGVSRAGFEERFGRAPLERRAGDLAELDSLGLIRNEEEAIALTDRGTMLANEVAARLLG